MGIIKIALSFPLYTYGALEKYRPYGLESAMYSNLRASLFSARKFLIVLEQCGVLLYPQIGYIYQIFGVSVLDNQQMYYC